MYTDFTAQVTSQQHEHELTARLERRRIAAERAVREAGGERLAVIARLAREAREARVGRSVSAHPAGW